VLLSHKFIARLSFVFILQFTIISYESFSLTVFCRLLVFREM